MVTRQNSGSLSVNTVPVLSSDVDLMNLGLDAQRGFVISRIDGHTRVKDIITITGFGEEQTISILQSLFEIGAISWKGADPAAGGAGKKPEKPKAAAAPPSPAAPLRLDMNNIPDGEAFLFFVDKLFNELPQLNPNKLLGVKYSADAKTIKKAYFRLSKVFHPDRYFRIAEPEFKRKLQEIFKQINVAYQTLSEQQKKAQAEEDASSSVQVEWMEEPPVPEKEKPVENKQEPEPPSPNIRIEKVAEEIKEEAPPKKEEGPKLNLGLKDMKKKKMEKRMESLKKSGFMERIEQAKRLYDGAMIEKDKGNIQAARVNLNLAMQHDPHNPKYKQALDSLHQMEADQKVELMFKQGVEAQSDGDMDKALRIFKELVRLDKDEHRYLYKLAEVMVEYKQDYNGARTLLLRAIENRKAMPKYHLLLGRIYKGLEQKQPAKVQFERVLELDPGNKEAAKELKSKWWK